MLQLPVYPSIRAAEKLSMSKHTALVWHKQDKEQQASTKGRDQGRKESAHVPD